MNSTRRVWLAIFAILIYAQVNIAGDFLHDLYHFVTRDALHTQTSASEQEFHISVPGKDSVASASSSDECPFSKLLGAARSAHFSARAEQEDVRQSFSAVQPELVQRLIVAVVLNPNACPRGPPKSVNA